MSDVLTLEAVDKDGALGEALENLGADTRKGFLKKIAIGGTTVMAGGAIAALVPSTALGQVGPAQDVRILNFALTLEFLEAEFYRQARIRNGLSGELRGFARTVGGHENAHVQFLRGALGARAVAKPRFDFGDIPADPTRFATTARVLEDTGVAAYNGQAQNLTKATLAAAASIVSVEARHAAWIRDILQTNPTPKAFDDALPAARIQAAVNATGFIQ